MLLFSVPWLDRRARELVGDQSCITGRYHNFTREPPAQHVFCPLWELGSTVTCKCISVSHANKFFSKSVLTATKKTKVICRPLLYMHILLSSTIFFVTKHNFFKFAYYFKSIIVHRNTLRTNILFDWNLLSLSQN